MKLYARRNLTVHLAIGQGINGQLQALACPACCLLRLTDIGGFIIDDHHLLSAHIHPVPAADDSVPTEGKAELPFHIRGDRSGLFLSVIESAERLPARLETLLLMFPREKPTAHPRSLKDRPQLLTRHRLPPHLMAEVCLDSIVEGLSVDHGVVFPDGHLQDLNVFVLERAGPVVVHAEVAQGQDFVRGHGLKLPRFLPDGGGKPRDYLVR